MQANSALDSGKKREENQNLDDSSSRNSPPDSNADIEDLLRSRKLLERERELAAREQNLLERERNANRIRNSGNNGVKGKNSINNFRLLKKKTIKKNLKKKCFFFLCLLKK